MSVSLKKLMNDYGIGAIIILLIVAYGVYMFAGYLGAKGMVGPEYNSEMQDQYKQQNSSAVQPSEPLGQNEMFAEATGGMQASIQNPAELLPKDTNSQWAQLNPSGKGDIGNINLLKAGYHIGIDTVGQSMRNSNLQLRSEPPNPQMSVSIWNNSTIEPDFLRVPLEIGSGPQ